MPPTDEQGEARLRQRSVLELVDGDVGRQVVDAEDRLAQPERERLGRGHADEEGAGQAGPAGHRDRVDVVRPDPGGLAGPLDGRHHRLEVGSAGHLGYDASETRVLVHTAGDGVGEQRAAADDADPGLVARRLDAEHEWFAHVGHCADNGGVREVGVEELRSGALTIRSYATRWTPPGSARPGSPPGR